MDLRRLLLLALALLLGGTVSAQTRDKVSKRPVLEIEKDKQGEVAEADPVAAPEVVGLDTTGGEVVLLYEDDEAAYTGSRVPSPPYDSAAAAPRPLPADALDRFRGDPDYQYSRVETEGPSLSELFWRWVQRTFFDPIDENTSPRFWRIFWPALAVLILAFALTRLLRGDFGGVFGRRDRALDAPEGPVLLDAERIEEIDLDALLHEALRNGRFRDAARFRYLLALQRLAARDLIVWEKNKTNRDYLAEVRRAGRASLNAPFAEVTRLFEWIWYGEAPLDAARFDAVRDRFDRFDAALATAPTTDGGRA